MTQIQSSPTDGPSAPTVTPVAAKPAAAWVRALPRVADGLAVGVAASLPWSSSLTAFMTLLWLLAVVPTFDGRSMRDAMRLPETVLPIALCALALLGIAWAEAPVAARLSGTEPFLRLLAIPVLIMQFRRSEMSVTALAAAFGASCTLLLAWSYLGVAVPAFAPAGKPVGNPVKDYVSQSGVFTLCAAVLIYIAVDAWRGGRRVAAALAITLAALFLANILYVSTSRTTLLVIPVLLLVFAFRRFGGLQVVALMAAVVVVAFAVWSSSAYVRLRIDAIGQDFVTMQQANADTSTGARLFFWGKSLAFIRDAPVLGHGTGAIEEMFRRDAASGQGATATNPHNQLFHVGIQLGMVGIAVLIAMWAAHVRLFAGRDLVSWIGLCVVLQNILSSLFNSHLADFTQGWLYVCGVGICGGLLARQRAGEPSAAPGTS